MSNIVLLIDSGADVPSSVSEQRGFHVVRMHTTMGNTSFNDGEFPVTDLFSYYEKTGDLPKTSASTPDDFERTYTEIRRANPDAQIVYLAYSAATTAAFQSAHIAAEHFDGVTMIDTKFCSAGQAAVVYHIADMLDTNPSLTPEQIRSEVEAYQKRLHMLFIPGDLQYLKAGGRLSNAGYVGARLLNLHPRIETIDGKLVCTHKYRGNQKKVYIRMLKEFLSSKALDHSRFYLIESHGLDADVKNEAESIVNAYSFEKVEWIQTGGVVSVHCGPGAFGFVCAEAQ